MSSLVIKNAHIVSSKKIFQADVLIEDGKIKELGEGLQASQQIDATGLHLIPGVLDPQVHFRDPGFEWKEDFETGSRAAASGGVTSFFDMPNTNPLTITREAMKSKKERAAQKSLVNYNFFIGATPNNLEELNAVENVCGIKIFMGSSTGSLLVSEMKDLDAIFSKGQRLIAVHAEDEAEILKNQKKMGVGGGVLNYPQIRSPLVALKATQNAVLLSKKYRRRLHILHLSTAEETEFLAREKEEGLISAEVCPQHFLLHAPEVYEKLGCFAQMNPPLRDKRHGEALWKALKAGVIDCIATDHAPHTSEEKKKPYGDAPSGMPGVETSLPLMLNRVHEGKCLLQDVVKWMCENPYLLYRVKNKGQILPGFDADLVLVDLKKRKMIENEKLYTKVRWSPYHGWTLQGWPVMTFVNGNLVFREGEFFEQVKGREIQIMDPSIP
jgi:dihydroorotase